MNARRSFLRRLILVGVLVFGSVVVADAQDNRQHFDNIIKFERDKIFDDVVRIASDHFMDVEFDTEEWAIRAKQFREKALNATTHDGFSEVANELLGTLKTSHTRYYSKLDPKRYQLLGVFSESVNQPDDEFFCYDGIGIDTRTTEGVTRIVSVFDGLPAASAGLRFGDRIVNVDGGPFHPFLSFAGKSGEEVSVEVLRGDKRLVKNVTVELLDGRTMFEKALVKSKRIIEQNGKTIGYLHVWSYAGQQYQDIIQSEILFGELSACDALVIDLRDGWGGANVNYLNLFRAPLLQLKSISRTGGQRNFTGVWEKPVSLVVNGRSTSGKELFTYGFMKHKLGTVFGEQTAGAVVGGRMFLLNNGDVLYLAVSDLEVDGQRLEGIGVKPDHLIERPLENSTSDDHQVDAAVTFLVEKLSQNGEQPKEDDE